MPEDLAAGLVLFRTTFRRQLGPIVLMWPGLLMSCCLFGLPLWVLAVVGLVAASLGDHGRPANAAWRAAVLVAGLGLSIGAASLILAFATQPWSAEAGVPWMLVEIALCAAVALLHAPFFFAPFAACDLRRPEGLGEAVGFSFELSARQGLGATLSTAIVPIVLTHAAMTLGFLGVHVLSQSEEPGLGLAVACAGMFALPFAWALGLAFVGARYAPARGCAARGGVERSERPAGALAGPRPGAPRRDGRGRGRGDEPSDAGACLRLRASGRGAAAPR
jgi:hypothetical protein